MKPPWNVRRCALAGAVFRLLLQLLPHFRASLLSLGLSEGDDFQRALGAVVLMAATMIVCAAIFALGGQAVNRLSG
jgi:hypothetical protein